MNNNHNSSLHPVLLPESIKYVFFVFFIHVKKIRNGLRMYLKKIRQSLSMRYEGFGDMHMFIWK